MDKIYLKEEIEHYIENNNLSKAEELSNRYKLIYNFDTNIASIDAIINIYKQDLDSALHSIKKGLKLNIENGDLYANLGLVYELKSNYNLAYICYQKALFHLTDNNTKNIIQNNINILENSYNLKSNSISVVIAEFSSIEYIKICLESIMHFSDKYVQEIILIDNNYNSNDIEELTKQYNIKFISNISKLIHYLNPCNDILFLNNDTIVLPNTIFNLMMSLYSDNNVSVVIPNSNKTFVEEVSFDKYLEKVNENNFFNEENLKELNSINNYTYLIKNPLGQDILKNADNFSDIELLINKNLKNVSIKAKLCINSFVFSYNSSKKQTTKIAGLSMVKNEEDIIESSIRHNLLYLDKLFIIDNDSSDSTLDIIKNLRNEGLNIEIFTDSNQEFKQGEKMTKFADLIHSSYNADFYFLLDADEFIKADSKEDLIKKLDSSPIDSFNLVPWQTMVKTDLYNENSIMGMTFRRTIEQPQYYKVILNRFFFESDSYIAEGNHLVLNNNIKTNHTILEDIFLSHIPIRSKNQLISKVVIGWLAFLMKDINSAATGQGYQWYELYNEYKKTGTIQDSSLQYISKYYAQNKEAHIDLTYDPIPQNFNLKYTTTLCKDPLPKVIDCFEKYIISNNKKSIE